jgi:hypothetical protein
MFPWLDATMTFRSHEHEWGMMHSHAIQFSKEIQMHDNRSHSNDGEKLFVASDAYWHSRVNWRAMTSLPSPVFSIVDVARRTNRGWVAPLASRLKETCLARKIARDFNPIWRG